MKLIHVLLVIALISILVTILMQSPEVSTGYTDEEIKELHADCKCSTILPTAIGRLECPSCGKDHGKCPEYELTIIGGINPGLISLEEHNKSTFQFYQQPQECITNIACPKCGNPLYKNLMMVLTSNPVQYYVRCKSCKYSGTCY